GVVLEEVVDALLLHEPAGEGEVGLAVLHTEVAGMEVALDLVLDAQAIQHLFQDLGDADVLEDAALGLACEHPELGHHLQPVGSEVFVAPALAEAAAKAVEVARWAAGYVEANRDGLAEEYVERDLGPVLGEEIELEAKQLRNRLRAGEA